VRLDLASENQIVNLFLRFFPDQKALSHEFSKVLPVGRISMAKLQGHLLLYRDDANQCIEHARDLLKDDSALVQRGMTVDEWLHRLNLLHLKSNFEKQKLRRVEELVLLSDEGQLTEQQLVNDHKLNTRRMWNMMIGDAETKENFKYLSKHGIRSIGAIFLDKASELEELVNQVPEDVITGFHLRDIFDTTKKYSEIRTKLYDCIMFNKRFPKTVSNQFLSLYGDRLVKTKEEEEEVAKPKINFDLEKFFKDAGAPECIVKLQKQDLLDPILFFKIEVGALEGILELKPEGKKRRVMKKVKEVREKFEKEGRIEYLDLGLLEPEEGQLPVLKFQKSTTFAPQRAKAANGKRASSPEK